MKKILRYLKKIALFQVAFQDVFGEPDHVKSLSCTWMNTKKVFIATHQKCYLVLSTIFGLPLAVCWGVKFACTSFWAVWCCYPALLSCRHVLFHVKKGYTMFMRCWLDPLYESLSLVLSNIHVTMSSTTLTSQSTRKLPEETL